MKLVRPYIPLSVRIEVIARQLQACGKLPVLLDAMVIAMTQRERLEHLLASKFGTEKIHLDHDPSLVLRYYDEETGEYDPPANDPRYLVYRTAEEHREKTFIRGDGAQFSDAAKRRRKIKQERKEEPQRPRRWPPRVGRRWPTRPLQWWTRTR